jgi:hypothetical protein
MLLEYLSNDITINANLNTEKREKRVVMRGSLITASGEEKIR